MAGNLSGKMTMGRHSTGTCGRPMSCDPCGGWSKRYLETPRFQGGISSLPMYLLVPRSKASGRLPICRHLRSPPGPLPLQKRKKKKGLRLSLVAPARPTTGGSVAQTQSNLPRLAPPAASSSLNFFCSCAKDSHLPLLAEKQSFCVSA